ncbi:glycerophosphodiester phosphodiesterase [Mucilaginibacter sp. SP1R1]|uniref:glycerophosphodiester phosphodiesterase n=1 Tax=Mucilaginibacter sp. SP1R1 TaxID=2723091 RepID=UPI00160B2A9D|nr:glycerophosphodiester phosphodiesterase family protein [Mucilaginibacter sp. SP1R1]MBB6149977.1 glycerophosphoryl diester phosphodiesterase [Mucilaginibacter sp. SP1R1]
MKLFLYSLTTCLVIFQNTWQPNPVPKQRHRFMVIAHRGDHVNYPENTLAAYQQAIKDGADYVEIDLRTTKDGQLISLHNESVDRMTNGTGLVKDLTFDEIKKLKIKTTDQSQNINYTIPSFQEILSLCKNKIYIYIDFKDAAPVLVDAVLKQFNMEDQVLVYINKPEQLTAWRLAAPKIPLMLSLPEDVIDSLTMERFLDQSKADLLDGDYRQYNPGLLAIARKHHIEVWPDGQSKTEGPIVWNEAIKKGLIGLQTDEPEELINYLKKTNRR